MSHTHSKECNCKSTIAVQSLDEMDFERGIWTAGNYLKKKPIEKSKTF